MLFSKGTVMVEEQKKHSIANSLFITFIVVPIIGIFALVNYWIIPCGVLVWVLHEKYMFSIFAGIGISLLAIYLIAVCIVLILIWLNQ